MDAGEDLKIRPSDTRPATGAAPGHGRRAVMRPGSRFALSIVGFVAVAGFAAGCGEEGSSGTEAPDTAASGAGCAPVAGNELVVLEDDKKLQTVDNVIPAINAKASSPAMIAALDKVSAALDTGKLIALNKAVAVDRKTSKVAAEEFASSAQLTSGISKGSSGNVKIGAANFPENQTLGELYRIVLTAAGYNASVQTIGNRELYEPALERGEIQVVPEYVGTLTEFLNKKANGPSATPLASSDLDKSVAALKDVGGKAGLTFGAPSPAQDQNAFAVTKPFADQHQLKTLSDLASKCAGTATVLGGPPECPQRPFCQPGLEQTYGMKFGQFASLDPGGPQTLTALRNGTISVGLVFSSDAALTAQ
jgi:osmoprotectant transport system substrate-binding protein